MQKFLSSIKTHLASSVVKQKKAKSNKKFQPDKNNRFLIIAHRGASGYAPENTLAAYELAKEMNVYHIELDIHLTKDRYILVIHDLTVDRTTDGKGRVRHLTLEEIKKLDAGSWFNEKNPEKAAEHYRGLQVLTLDEVFEQVGPGVKFYIEIKHPHINIGIEEKLLSLLKKYRYLENGMAKNIVIQSFSSESLKKIAQLESSLPLIQLQLRTQIEKMTLDKFKQIRTYAIGVGPSYKYIDDDYVSNAKAAGLSIYPFTVNETSEIQRMKELGVDGVITDFVDLYKS